MNTIRHMSLNIEGALNWSNLKGLFEDEDGSTLTHKEAKIYLLECKAKGWKLIPCGKCEGFDYQTGCPGHAIED